MHTIIRFAAVMGPLLSVFDLLTFGGLIYLFQASPPEFRTAWFLESIATQILVIFIIPTIVRPWHDWPHPTLTATSLGALLVAMSFRSRRSAPGLGLCPRRSRSSCRSAVSSSLILSAPSC